MSDFRKIRLSVPGKLFIAGEYAVTRPNHLALIAAIETDFSIGISENREGKSLLHTNVGLPDYFLDMENFSYERETAWNFTLKTLELLELPKSPQISIDIQSGVGFEGQKKGYGSSASIVSGIVKAANLFYQLNLSEEEQFRIAAQAHYQVQGSGSLGDVAAIISGNAIFYRSPKIQADEKLSDYLIQPLELLWDPYVIGTGHAVKTEEKLKVRLSEKFLRQSDGMIKNLLESRKFTEFKKFLLENQELLIENLPAGYVTEKLDLALKMVNSHPRMVGKISGAGFGENMIVFANQVSEAEIRLLRQSLEQREMTIEKIKLSERKDR